MNQRRGSKSFAVSLSHLDSLSFALVFFFFFFNLIRNTSLLTKGKMHFILTEIRPNALERGIMCPKIIYFLTLNMEYGT
jgi:hypothetical protein